MKVEELSSILAKKGGKNLEFKLPAQDKSDVWTVSIYNVADGLECGEIFWDEPYERYMVLPDGEHFFDRNDALAVAAVIRILVENPPDSS